MLLHPPQPSLQPPRQTEKMLMEAYIKVISVHSLVVQRDCHSDADVRFPLDGGRGDDEVVGVIAH